MLLRHTSARPSVKIKATWKFKFPAVTIMANPGVPTEKREFLALSQERLEGARGAGFSGALTRSVQAWMSCRLRVPHKGLSRATSRPRAVDLRIGSARPYSRGQKARGGKASACTDKVLMPGIKSTPENKYRRGNRYHERVDNVNYSNWNGFSAAAMIIIKSCARRSIS